MEIYIYICTIEKVVTKVPVRYKLKDYRNNPVEGGKVRNYGEIKGAF